jgi:GNAT superfamily N-acetyltransferase
MEYKQEFLITCQKDIEPLLISHWRELALYTDEIKLEPDFDRYKELEDLGKLKIFTLRDDGTLVGYLVVFEDNHLHYASTRWASSDVLYLKKEYRKMTFGAELISFAEQCLREDGVDVFMVGMKVHKPFDKLMTNLGYNPVERTYGKKL